MFCLFFGTAGNRWATCFTFSTIPAQLKEVVCIDRHFRLPRQTLPRLGRLPFVVGLAPESKGPEVAI